MISELQQLEKEALAELAAATLEEQILAVRTKYLGRKGTADGTFEKHCSSSGRREAFVRQALQ